MLAQEKVIDGFVELIKRDQLDENIQTEVLEKCISYFYTMHPVLFVTDNNQNHTQLLSDNVKVLLSATEGITNDAMVIRNLVDSVDIGDIGLLSQYIITIAEQLQQQLKLVKRRIPLDTNITNLGLNKEIVENLYQCYIHAGKILKTLQETVKSAVQVIIASGGKFI